MPIRRRMFLAAAAALLAPGGVLAAPAVAPIGARRLSLVNVHTGETFSGPYRDDDGPIAEAMADLSLFLRDHRAARATAMDLAVIDFLYDVMREAGVERATVLSGYRTRETNAMLAATQFGVADLSQHIFGRAIDVRFDQNLERAASAARAMNRGGVGWYPRSGFIHLDSGTPRSWSFEDADLTRLLMAGLTLRGRRPPSVAERNQRLRLVAYEQCRTRRGSCRQPVVVLRGRR
jgi:uncharacterized protein YcbK (DUF882 family)